MSYFIMIENPGNRFKFVSKKLNTTQFQVSLYPVWICHRFPSHRLCHALQVKSHVRTEKARGDSDSSVSFKVRRHNRHFIGKGLRDSLCVNMPRRSTFKVRLPSRLPAFQHHSSASWMSDLGFPEADTESKCCWKYRWLSKQSESMGKRVRKASGVQIEPRPLCILGKSV